MCGGCVPVPAGLAWSAVLLPPQLIGPVCLAVEFFFQLSLSLSDSSLLFDKVRPCS
jgi:hypothetical protein|uniref:Uncharacterized protein n=1 Tax=Zea mays TaxID=4577 RepID=B6T0Y9_MAIZE|nr:hypothetical protein [Zea mays]